MSAKREIRGVKPSRLFWLACQRGFDVPVLEEYPRCDVRTSYPPTHPPRQR